MDATISECKFKDNQDINLVSKYLPHLQILMNYIVGNNNLIAQEPGRHY